MTEATRNDPAMKPPSSDDLSRLRSIAEQGRSAPLLGGWHLVLWGSAIALALLINWAVAERILPWPSYSLAISWFGIVILAWIGSALLGRSEAKRPGAFSVGNQVERAAWTTAGAFLGLLSLALFARAAAGDPQAWDMFAVMPPVTFGAYAIALHASAVAADSGTSKPYIVVALAFGAATAFLIGNPIQYLAAAAGILLVSVPPGLGHLRAARRAD
ncbi:MAG TPA: hypothetical protein VF582_05650 [Allosphingosinicella sp.]|jgi:hypothetical protein